MGAPQYEQAGADIGGTGTTNTIPRWTGASTLGDSGLIDDGTQVYTTTRRVGLGTATPNAATRLHVVGTTWITGGNLLVDTVLPFTGGTTPLNVANLLYARVDTNNVGIGTTSPGAILHTLGTGATTGIFATSSASAYVELRRSTSTTLGYIGTGAGLVTGGAVSDLAFRCESGNLLFSTVATERARIDSTGNLLMAGNGTAANPIIANSTGVSGMYFPSATTVAIAANGAIAATFSKVAGAGVALGGTTGLVFDASGTQQGLKLPATPGNADTQTLDCYLDGGASGGATWAPVDNSGAGLTFTVTSARYMRIGRLVLASFDITFPATASGAQAKISLPVTAQAVWQGASIGFGPNVPGLSAAVNNADLNFWTYGAATTNAALSGARLIVSMSYFAN